jgi:glycosyltransferase involved in cell wall biosynthesis
VTRTIDSPPDRPLSQAPALTVIVAARNEEPRIAATLAALGRAFPGAVLWVADDDSRDDTAAIAAGAGAQVSSTSRNVGKGASMTQAARRALADAGAGEDGLFLVCDGDLGDSAAQLAPLVAAVASEEADLAVAAFASSVGGGFGLALGFARWAIARRCGLRTRAPISGQRALNRRALCSALPFAYGFGMEVGMTIDVVRSGARVIEIELDLSHRATGRTPAGFAHRARQLADFARAYLARR